MDAVEGGKFQVALAPRVNVTILGDAGGANARLDYQVAGLLGFRVTKKWVVQAGYRYFVCGLPATEYVRLQRSAIRNTFRRHLEREIELAAETPRPS